MWKRFLPSCRRATGHSWMPQQAISMGMLTRLDALGVSLARSGRGHRRDERGTRTTARRRPERVVLARTPASRPTVVRSATAKSP